MENHLRIAGVVILYRPNWNEVVENINSYFPYLEQLYIFDNTEGAASALPDALASLPHLTYFNEGVNEGIAKRLNQACELAIGKGYDWLLTMDQDSQFENEEISGYLQCIQGYSDLSKVAMFGVEYVNRSDKSGCIFEETDNLITSGSLVHLSVCAKLGSFDEKLFIDEVDSEFCLRAMVNGYKAVRVANIFMQHSLGNVSQHRSLKSLKQTSRTLHSPIRVYYMIRNYLYMKDKYHEVLPDAFPYRKKTILNRIKNNLLYGEKRITLLKYMWKAVSDYKKGNMGKFHL